MTSSLRNSLHRRNHKERSQLAHRVKLGVLEKHKDYVLRARDYHKKQDRIKRLKQKAEEKNKDEFYFGMNREKTKGGVHVHERGNQALPTDMVKILKTQDENYVRTMRSAGIKKIEKIKAQLTQMADLLSPKDSKDSEDSLGEDEIAILQKAGVIHGRVSRSPRSRAKNHIVFVENEAEASNFASTSNTRIEDVKPSNSSLDNTNDLGWKLSADNNSRKPKKQKVAQDGEIGNGEDQEDVKKHRTRLLKELSARLVRDTQLRYAIRELEMQRLLMGKGSSKRIRGIEKIEGEEKEEDEEEDEKPKSRKDKKEKAYKPRVYKWRLERKR